MNEKIKSTNIQFFHPFSGYSETQFDEWNEKELALLWWEFCKENEFIRVEKGYTDYETGEWI